MYFFIYSIIINLVFLFSPILVLIRLIKKKEDPNRYKEKFCIYQKKNSFKSVWFHAASVGEFMSIIPVLENCERNKEIKQIILTTSTRSSAKIFENYKFKKTFHKYYPLDTNYLTNKFIKTWKPKLAIFVDSEIWPNMFKNLEEKRIPIILLNARITEKSYKRWKIFEKFANEVFSKISLALPSSLETKKFLKKLGTKKIFIAGNLKFYGKNRISTHSKFSLKKKFKNFKILCAASTHEKEEILIAKLHKNIKKKQKKLLTIIIPRHINRAERIINDLKKIDLKIITHSSGNAPKKNTDIYLVDTYGEARKFYQLSNITFVGGSVVKHGGQNPLEPSRLGNYIINGPNIQNFEEIYAFLTKNKISITTSNIKKMQNEIEKKLNKKLPKFKVKKIFNIGEKILSKNIYYLFKYIA
tara:strand:+ start:1500 stop:2741 length:1242 start_codon:yes stop_codon:yes gene_type:complete